MSKDKYDYSHLEPFFGTPHIDQFSKKELQKELKNLLDVFFDIDFENKDEFKLSQSSLDKLLRILEIIQFGRDRYPFLISLDFDTEEAKKGKYNLFETHIWKDPHYEENSEGMPSAFKGDMPSIPNLFGVKKDPQIFTGTVRNLLIREIRNEEQNSITKIFIGGTKNAGLVLGIPKKEFFTNRTPIYSIHRPIVR